MESGRTCIDEEMVNPNEKRLLYSTELLLDFGSDGKKLVPVVLQDAVSRDVLFVGSANAEALQMTLDTRLATLWSKSRNELWVKGATSGDSLRVVDVRVNCEQSSLLYLVEMLGKGVCHAKNPHGSPYQSCYYRNIINGRLEFI